MQDITVELLQDAHVDTFINAMADEYSHAAEVHNDYEHGMFTKDEYNEVMDSFHPAVFSFC